MSRYDAMFKRLADKKEGAFIPFVVLFDPDREMSKTIIQTMIDAGADALEVGIAFSDPLADGPTIQKADLRALRSGSRVKDALSLIKEVRLKNEDIPIGILTYANLVFRNGLDGFYGQCEEAGVDSVLVADVSLIEAKPYCESALRHNVDPVLIAPPNLPLSRCHDIAQLGRGYTYVVTRRGVTGARDELSFRNQELLRTLKDCGAPPSILGFGISAPDHVKLAMSMGAKGAISGSRVVSIIEENLTDKAAMMKKLTEFIKVMKAATIM
jgi:tryptophan synthase alpha chain